MEYPKSQRLVKAYSSGLHFSVALAHNPRERTFLVLQMTLKELAAAKKKVAEQITFSALHEFSGIELVKAANVWRVEEASVRRVLLRRAIGCTASEKEH